VVTRKLRKTARNSKRAGIVALLVLTGCAGRPATRADNAYVDAAVCASCHAGIAKSYRETGMARSFYRANSAAMRSQTTFYHKASDRYYEFSALRLARHQIGFGGKDTNRVEKAIDFVVGSGNHARTYLSTSSEGRLVELPVTWYSEKGGYLAMSPGYDHARQEDFRRLVPDDCLFCHNGYPDKTLAEGIDCQRCHGPGSAHVRAAGSGKAKPAEIRAAIVNPARLDRDRQLDDCMQCHLETTSLRLPNAIRNYDCAPFSYRPGEPLAGYQQYFDHATGTGFDDRFEVAHQAYRLRKSACFARSAMTCSTCHDPHRALRGASAVEHYVRVCRTCHEAAHSSGMPSGGANCLDCHMWKRRAEDAVHVVMTDHFIQRRKPSRDLTAPLEEKGTAYQNEVLPYYPERAPSDLYLAVAQVQHESNLAAGIPRLIQAITKERPDAPEFYLELGQALSKSGKVKEAIGWYEQALRHREGFHPALRELAAAFLTSGNLARAVEVGERASAQQPPDTVALTNLGNAYLRLGNADRARQILERALTVDPDLPEARNLLGLVELAKQDPAAEVSFREAIAIQPDMAEAHNNLANLLAGRRNFAEAEYEFQKAIASNPAYVEAHHSYGLLLVLMRSFDRATAELREAVRLDPNTAQLRIDFADILLERGRTAEAGKEYRRAVKLNPASAEAYYGLGSALAAAREPDGAIRAFESAIERKPDYYEAHLALGTAMKKAGNPAVARQHFQRAAESDDPIVRNDALKALR
jgi:tetratricopeptide (TPR) repeat protein